MQTFLPKATFLPSARPPVYRGGRQHIPCRSAGKETGRLLRDALTQPKQGTNLTLLAAGNYLRSLGIANQTDVTRILDILTNPNSLFGTKGGKKPVNPYARRITVDEMQAVVDFLTAVLPADTVVGVILEFPQVLSYSVSDRLQPFFEFLEAEVGLPKEKVGQVVSRRPALLGLQKGAAERLVEYLQVNGSDKEEIVRLLETTL